MTAFKVILFIVGLGLLLLGAASGYALFARSLKLTGKFGNATEIGTLWGLFLIGVTIGLIFTWLSLL